MTTATITATAVVRCRQRWPRPPVPACPPARPLYLQTVGRAKALGARWRPGSVGLGRRLGARDKGGFNARGRDTVIQYT